MRRLPESKRLYVAVKEARVFRDDLEDIVSLFSEAGLQVQVSAGNYAFDSLEEMHKHTGARPKEVTIKGVDPADRWSALEVEVEDGHIILSGSTELASGLAFRVRDQVQRLAFEPPLGRFLFWWIFGVALLLIDWLVPDGTSNWHRALTLSPVAAYAIGFATFPVRRVFCGVHLTRRHETGFWNRNKDALILLVLGAVIGGIISAVIGQGAGK